MHWSICHLAILKKIFHGFLNFKVTSINTRDPLEVSSVCAKFGSRVVQVQPIRSCSIMSIWFVFNVESTQKIPKTFPKWKAPPCLTFSFKEYNTSEIKSYFASQYYGMLYFKHWLLFNSNVIPSLTTLLANHVSNVTAEERAGQVFSFTSSILHVLMKIVRKEGKGDLYVSLKIALFCVQHLFSGP